MAEFETRMETLRQRFTACTRGEADLVAAYTKIGDRNALRDLCHAIAGTAGMFGFRALGEVEDAIDAYAADMVLESLATQLLAELSDCLRDPEGAHPAWNRRFLFRRVKLRLASGQASRSRGGSLGGRERAQPGGVRTWP
jgi:HPt (histidine-containing phosphotransfer) domain-containing protein